MSKSRIGALLGFALCCGIFWFKWFTKEVDFGDLVTLMIAGVGVVMGLAGAIWPEQFQLDADSKLKPFAHVAGLAGFGVGGLVWFLLYSF